MKKITIITLILLTGIHLSAQQKTWNIVNKDMGQWNDKYADVNAANSYAWGTVPVNEGKIPSGETVNKTAFQSFVTQYTGFVRLQKPVLSGTGTFLLNPNVENTTSGAFHTAVQANTSYTVELKIQVNPQFGGADANEIRMRLGGRQMDFFISYGDGFTGYVSKSAKGSDYEIDPLKPHVYRVEYTSNSSYELYVDNVLAFSEASTSSSGANILVTGASAANSCNMDIFYVRMKTAGSSAWDILNKYMDQWNGAQGGWNQVSVADWTLYKGSALSESDASIAKATEDGISYVNIAKSANITPANSRAFYLSTPETSVTQMGAETITNTEPYTVEVMARIPANSADGGNSIKVRLFDKIMGIVLLDGEIANGVKHPVNAGLEAGPERKAINTSVWQTYRLVMSGNQSTYSVYANGAVVFQDLPALGYESGNSFIRLGAESFSRCNMDVASVKMGAGDLGLSIQETWDILNKSMSAWNVDGGSTTNQAWLFTKGSHTSDASVVVTQEAGYVNVFKTETFDNNNYGFLTPPALTLKSNTAYTFEVKARMKPIDKTAFPDIAPPASGTGGYESNQISARLNSKNMTIYVKYGDETTGYLSLAEGLSHSNDDKYLLNTSEWHTYRFVFHADNLQYDVYIDDIKEPVFENAPVSSMTGTNILRLGGHTNHRSNMDIEYVKMGTGNFNERAMITSVSVSSDSHVANNERTIIVTAYTSLINNGEKLLVSLADPNGVDVAEPVEITVTDNIGARGAFVIPATVPMGKYALKVAAPDANAGDVTVKPVSVQYVVTDVSPIDAKMFPQVKPVGFIKDINDYQYIGQSREFIMPSIFDTKKYTVDGKFLNGQDTLARYYLFYTPHENPGGMYLSTAPTLDGPWTERGTVIDLAWAKAVSNNSINTASHISGCFVDWNEELNKYIMYFHGPNSVTHYATSDNLRIWTFGGTVAHAKDFSTIGEEASYAKVYRHEIPGLGNKYVMLLMNQEAQVRRIYWAHSNDGVNWTYVRKPLISPDLDYKKIPGTSIKPNYSSDPAVNDPNLPASMGKNNVAGSTLMEKDGRYFVFCNGSSGHIFVIEVGESFDMEVHWGEYMKASDVVIDTDASGNPLPAPRIAAPIFIQDDNGKWYLFFECGGRVGANIAYAKEEDSELSLVPLASGSDPVISTQYYDLLGKPVTQPQRSAIYIVKELRQSGKTTIKKIIEN
jgi:hypothetical protein